MSAAGVTESTAPILGDGPGSTPRAALHSQLRFTPKAIVIRPIPTMAAKDLCQRHHYSHSYPGGSLLNFGMFVETQLLGVSVIGVGPTNLHRYFREARPEQVMCLTRLWLDDQLGRNSESRCLAIILRHLRREQIIIKAVVAYSDPSVGHTGIIYRGAGFLFLGTSQATPRYRILDGTAQHSRSFSHRWGTRDRRHFAAHGLNLELVPQASKLTYAYLLDHGWRDRLMFPPLPYPRLEGSSASC